MENETENICDIKKDLGIIDERGNTIIALREISWYGKDPKLDLRKYRVSPNGEERADRGVGFLTEQGPHTLTETLVENGYGDTNKILTSLSCRDDFNRNYSQVTNRKSVKTVDQVSPLAEAVGVGDDDDCDLRNTGLF